MSLGKITIFLIFVTHDSLILNWNSYSYKIYIKYLLLLRSKKKIHNIKIYTDFNFVTFNKYLWASQSESNLELHKTQILIACFVISISEHSSSLLYIEKITFLVRFIFICCVRTYLFFKNISDKSNFERRFEGGNMNFTRKLRSLKYSNIFSIVTRCRRRLKKFLIGGINLMYICFLYYN